MNQTKLIWGESQHYKFDLKQRKYLKISQNDKTALYRNRFNEWHCWIKYKIIQLNWLIKHTDIMFIASTYAYLTTLYLTTDLFLNVYMSSKAKKK